MIHSFVFFSFHLVMLGKHPSNTSHRPLAKFSRLNTKWVQTDVDWIQVSLSAGLQSRVLHITVRTLWGLCVSFWDLNPMIWHTFTISWRTPKRFGSDRNTGAKEACLHAYTRYFITGRGNSCHWQTVSDLQNCKKKKE